MRRRIAWLSVSIALMPLPALAADVLTIVSPVGIGVLIAAGAIGFGIGKFIK